MAKRIYVVGNALVIQDNGAGTPVEVEIPKRLVYIDRVELDDNANIRFRYIDNTKDGVHRNIADILLSNAVTLADATYNATTFETFFRANLGA